jgi:cell division protein FtsW
MVIGTMISLALVLLSGLGHAAGGAQRWLVVPGTPFKFQPSEFAKGVLVILLAVKLSVNQGDIKSFTRGFMPAIGLTFIFALLVLLENDLGIPVVMGATAFLMIFMAGTRWIYVIASTILGGAGVAAIALTTPHRIERLVAFRDPWRYAQDSGFQLIQSLAAFARGSVFGQGIGGSEQKLFYLPASHTDFIFAVWGEEAGLVGTLLVVLLFGAFLAVALRVALCAPDLFGTLLAAGIAGLIGVEAALNMGVTTGLLPTKGLPLPFISYGGSALIANLTMVGVLLNIALQSSEEEAGGRFAAARA